ncbi:MAG: M6 family metalloprotease domain-containing protein [Dictyoglomaceae bacterium]
MRKVIGFLVFLILILSFTFAETLPLTKVKIMPPHEKLIEKKIKLPTLPQVTPISIPKDKKIYGIIEKAEGVGKAIVIPVHFTDKPKQPENIIPSNYFDILFNSVGATWSYINPYNVGSVKEFYKENSYNKFDVTATILPWYTAQKTYTYYINDGNYGFDGGVFVLVQEVLQHAVNSGYDLRNFDVIFIIHSGEGAEWTGNVNDIWSHASTVYVNIGGQIVPIRYSIEPEYMKDNNIIIPSTVGVFVHEMGHSFGQLPDLYDRDYSSRGLGRWSLMAGGSWNGPQGPSGYTMGGSPSHFDAWCKIQLGWITPIVPTDNLTNVNIPPVETNPVVYKLWTDGMAGDQYFLLENRRKIGFDAYLIGEGLLIYHVDEKMRGSQNDNEWYPGLDPSKHYLVALEQADGKWDLEKDVNSGDTGDPYPGSANKTTFDENSTPNSNAYGEIPTGVAVRNITVSGNNIICDIKVKSEGIPATPSFIHHIGWSSQDPLTTRPLFKWTPVTYATEYNLQVATDVNFNNLVINIITSDTEYRPPLTSPLSLGTTYYMRIRAGNANGYSDWYQKSFTTPTKLETLFVSDDGGEFGIAPYIENAFVDEGVGYFIIDVLKDQAVPTASYMQQFDWVLWAGDWGAIYEEFVQSEIINYLDRGGKLFITSQDLGWGYSEGYISETLYREYLKANFVQDDVGIYSIRGANGTIFEGLVFNLNTANSAQNQGYPDEIDPLEGAQAILIYNPSGISPIIPEIKLPENIKEKKVPSIVNKAISSSGTAGLRYVDPLKNYSVVYFSFGLEGVDISVNEILLRKVRALLLDIQPPTLTLTVTSSFNPNIQNCNISVSISDDLGYAYLTIKVYDTLNGQKNNLVKTIVNNQKVNNGSFNYTWNGRDEANTLLPNGKYIVEAVAIDEAGNSKSLSATTILNLGQSLSFVNVTKFTKSFNPKTGPAEIFFNLTQDAKVRFIVYNLAGEKVYERDLGYLFAGNHKIEWEGVNWKGIYLPNGLYLFQLVAESSQGEARINRFIGILK